MTYAEAIESVRKWSDRIDLKLAAGCCPECNGAISGQRDDNQRGDSAVAGDWVRYRCGACGYVIDVKERKQ